MAIMDLGTILLHENDENYIYWNGNHYYRMSDGTCGSTCGEWKPLTIGITLLITLPTALIICMKMATIIMC